MIYYLVGEQQVFPMRSFLNAWGKELATRVKIATYESVLSGRERLQERNAGYIFTNLGTVARMRAEARSKICDLHDRLVELNGLNKVLNDPARSLQRYDLLRCMHERGINAFNVYRANETVVPSRFPVIVRHEAGSTVDQPSLVQDAAQYAAQLRGIKWLRRSLAGFIAIEFCDTAGSNGLYRKYGAFVVGDRIVPRHIFFSRNWHVKQTDVVEPATIEEERIFVDENPHAAQLLKYARLAGITYGRIDYGLLNGCPQIWEINTNASIASTPQATMSERRPAFLKFAAMFIEALAALDPAV